MSMVRLSTLGGVDLRGPEGREIRSVLAQPKRLALLVYLAAARPPGFHRRDTLLALLWPDAEPSRARNALSVALHHLKRSLGEEVIVRQGDEAVGVDPDALWCDVAAFEAALRGGPSEAMDLYAGDFLSAFHLSGSPGFDEWLGGRRAELRDAAVRAGVAAAENAARRGDALEAVSRVRWALGHAPWDEAVLQRGLRLLDGMGNRSGALDAYEVFARRLRDELEVEPSPETERLVGEIRSRRAELAVAPLLAREPDHQSGPPAEAPRPGHEAERPPPIPGGTARRLRIRVSVVAAAVAGGVVFWAAWGTGRGAEASGSAPGSPDSTTEVTVAILPFRVSGPGTEIWREGMPDVLATNLDGAPGLRVVDPAAVFGRVGEKGGEEASPEARALDVARGLGADYALVGRVAVSGESIRIVTDLHDVRTGQRWQARAEGPQDSVLRLADRLAIDILSTGPSTASWSPGRRMPPFGSSPGMRTSSLPALLAFLEGERADRMGSASEAADHFLRAAELDSTFALALYRFAVSDIRSSFLHSPRAVEYFERAARFADRLPDRERLLLRSVLEPARQFEHLTEVTRLYPGHVFAWYQLGGAYKHADLPDPSTREKARYALRRAIDLDPRNVRGYSDLIGYAYAEQDSATVHGLVDAWSAIAPDHPRTIGKRLEFDLAFGGPERRRAAEAALDTASTDVLIAASGAIHQHCDHEMWEVWTRLGEALTAPRHPPAVGAWRKIRPLLCQGRLREARALMLDRREAAESRADTWRYLLVWHLMGYPDSVGAHRAAERLAADPTEDDRFYLGALAADEGRWEEVELQIAALEAMAVADVARGRSIQLYPMADALRAWAALRRHPPDVALPMLQAALVMGHETLVRQITDVPRMVRIEIGKLLLETGRYREAIPYFGGLFTRNWLFWAPSQLHLGRIYEELDELEAAEEHYATFVRAWERCDPEVRHLWEEGRRGLERVRRKREAGP